MKIQKKFAYTLAEVLITLAIAGVVTAMILPSLINKYKKIVVQDKLLKFYTTMTQAIKMEEIEQGDLENWLPACSGSGCLEAWFIQHISPHIITIEEMRNNSATQYFEVAFNDGSGFWGYNLNFMYCIEFKYCGIETYDGNTSFLFSISKNPNHNNKYEFITSNRTIQEFDRETLLSSCSKGNWDYTHGSGTKDTYYSKRRHACARLIEYDGWKIKDDYPWKAETQPKS